MKKILFCLVIILTATTAMADSKSLQLSLTPDTALHSRSETIEGLTLSIWGENQQSALSLGFVNGSSGESGGLSLGLILNYADQYSGVHLASVNYTSDKFFGLQLACVNFAGHVKGLQLGFVNYVYEAQTFGLQLGGVNYAGYMKGLQLGFVNYVYEEQTFGLQLGFVNYAGHMNGLQLGLINYAETVQPGVQIGIVNIIAQNEKWFNNFPNEVAPGMVLVNWRF